MNVRPNKHSQGAANPYRDYDDFCDVCGEITDTIYSDGKYRCEDCNEEHQAQKEEDE